MIIGFEVYASETSIALQATLDAPGSRRDSMKLTRRSSQLPSVASEYDMSVAESSKVVSEHSRRDSAFASATESTMTAPQSTPSLTTASVTKAGDGKVRNRRRSIGISVPVEFEAVRVLSEEWFTEVRHRLLCV